MGISSLFVQNQIVELLTTYWTFEGVQCKPVFSKLFCWLQYTILWNELSSIKLKIKVNEIQFITHTLNCMKLVSSLHILNTGTNLRQTHSHFRTKVLHCLSLQRAWHALPISRPRYDHTNNIYVVKNYKAFHRSPVTVSWRDQIFSTAACFHSHLTCKHVSKTKHVTGTDIFPVNGSKIIHLQLTEIRMW
jgi:hypothetical protein